MDKNILMVALMIALLAFSVMQTFQLVSLKGSLATGAVVKTTPTSSGSSGQVSVPSNLQNLPEMVGGC